jgi:lantibiotic modifying enzyme
MKIRFVVLPILFAALAVPTTSADRPYRAAALGAAQWIESTAISDKTGVVWPADPLDPKTVNTSLYAGTPGPILLFLEAYRYTGNKKYLEQARAGSDALMASISKEESTGLYEGIAGLGFTLGETYLVTNDKKYLDGAMQCVHLLQEKAQKTGKGVKWSEMTDIIGGNAGTGLFLLWAANELHADGARDLAIQAGEHSIESAVPQPNGDLKWMMDPTYPREMPNFSHGTAGVAYFLATLYQQTHQKEFLDAAVAGANYLLSIREQDPNICLIYHDDERKKLFYLAWCHGPAGTARLFYRLYQVTGDKTWLDWTIKSARAIVAEGGPQKAVSPGEWNNVGMCCGISAQGEFFFDLYRVTNDRQYLDLAKKASDHVLVEATKDAKGYRWVQVETRVRPDIAIAQTGYMQGASGIGLWMLHFDAALRNEKKPVIKFPDNPFDF